MAVTFKIRILDLLTEFLAHALVLLRALQPAWAVAAGALESLLNGLNDLLVFVEADFHRGSSL